jgi:hypothetical protein
MQTEVLVLMTNLNKITSDFEYYFKFKHYEKNISYSYTYVVSFFLRER